MKPATAAIVLLASVALGGCAAPLNERLAIGTRPTASFGGSTGPGMAGPGTLDRGRWRTMVVVSPIDGVVHTEPFRTPRPISRRSGPERVGAYPFSWDHRAPADDQAGRAAGELGRSVLDLWRWPRRGLRAWRGGWWTWSPVEVWKRTPPGVGRWSAVGGVRERTDDDGR